MNECMYEILEFFAAPAKLGTGRPIPRSEAIYLCVAAHRMATDSQLPGSFMQMPQPLHPGIEEFRRWTFRSLIDKSGKCSKIGHLDHSMNHFADRQKS